MHKPLTTVPQSSACFRGKPLTAVPNEEKDVCITGKEQFAGRGSQVLAVRHQFSFFCRHPAQPPHWLPDQTRRSCLQLRPPSGMTRWSSLRSLDVLLCYFQRCQGPQPPVYWASVAVGAHWVLHGSWRDRQPPKMRAVLELVELSYLPMVVALGPYPLCVQAKFL